ncbi:LysR family transcriptional regulator [Acinetobacter nosocomialis]|uniref:LysR family transcriptional regulator n=1 Tax=Acinetobacter nosocomialis TaxID=106654 RepID=UPI0026ECD18C|nr:LysR family transcriptional regulator [Acinetobacter nosocomialis]MDO7192611.1 LysR family transcriptional regulator [Acinetobacter nosocomialis]MDO7217180.1 LysR family transcriptional regulator [Acinetobacter nosocomialis]MDX7934787.1 LysR family transcriptional regulator [Acinetobacter baumannii]
MKLKQLQQISNADIKLLKIFKTVCECGSFTSAESMLGISRSAISLHISDLEQRVGFRLCQRGRAGFALTEEGKQLLEYMEILLASIEDFRVKVNQIHNKLKGEFNIGIINNLVTMPNCNITNTLRQLSSEHPDVKINISMSTLSDIESKVLDGRLHIGAIPFVASISGLDYFELYEEKSYLYCGNQHPLFCSPNLLSKNDLKKWDAVVPNYNLTTEAVDFHKLLNCKATATDREGIAFLILTGNFLGFLPEHYASKWVIDQTIIPILSSEIFYNTKICLITKKSKSKNMILNYFLEKISLKVE